MRTVYIDAEFLCHASPAENLTAIAVEKVFDDKCDAFIEGYRFIPEGESWMREDGIVFTGEMIAPAKTYEVLEAYQEEYERSGMMMDELIGGVEDVQQE